MNFVLLSIAVTLTAVLTIGGVMLIRGLRSAPEGFEDAEGFHYGRPNEALVGVSSPDFAACLDEELAYATR